jgi:hypothetical protein
MNSMRFRLTPATAALVGLCLAACEKRTEPPRDTERPPYQEPVREARPTTDTTPTERTAIDKAASERTESARPATTAPTAQNESAVSAITEARCDREARCNNVGNGKKFESRADCVTKTRADWRDDLNARECPNGVVSSQLTSCVTQIKDENCSNVVEKLETVLACRTVDLCKRG